MSDRSALTLPLLTSLLLHIAAGALGTRWSFDSTPSRLARADALAAIMPEAEPPPTEPDSDPLRLGLNESTATSLTWLGFDEYKEQIAKPSEVDQPELTMDPPSGPPTKAMAVVVAEPTPPFPETPETLSLEEPSPPASPSKTPVEQVVELEPVEEKQFDQVPVSEKTSKVVEETATEQDTEKLEKSETGDMPLPPDPKSEAPPEPNENKQKPPAEPLVPPTPLQPPPSPPVAPVTPAVPPAPSGSGAAGQQSDRESVASSILTAEWKKLGQPLAGKGLEIKTRRPKFTQYTRIMGAARNPIVRAHFRRDGRVERVDLVQSSGNADVDRPVIDAIYLWRATGEPLKLIPIPSPPATYPVEFRILM